MKLITDIGAGLAVIAGASAVDNTEPVAYYAGVLEKFGVMAVMLLYFLVRDYLRSKNDALEKASMANKLNELENFIREKLSEKLDDAVDVMRSTKRSNKALLEALENKAPCLSYAAKDQRKRQEDATTESSKK